MDGSHLVLRRLSKRYGGVAALRGLDLEVRRGELVVLLGPSGSGKTTALRLIAGLEEPEEGEVELGGRRLNGVSPRERPVALVFQTHALFPHLTVEENLALGLPRPLPREETRRRVRRAAQALGLEALLGRFPGQLAGGESQRVALGRGLLREPEVFLLDEPLSSLDPHLRASLRLEIRRLHSRLGATTLYVTHDQAESRTLGDRLVVLNAGRVEQAGPPGELHRAPRTAFVARFLGTPPMNLLPARIEVREGAPRVLLPGGAEVRLPPASLEGPPPAGAALAGLRPEDLRLVPLASARLRARVEAVEPLGRDRLLHLGLEALPPLELPGEMASFKAFLPREGDGLEEGAAVGLDFEDGALHLFDARSGLALKRGA